MREDSNKNNFQITFKGFKTDNIEIAEMDINISVVPMSEANQNKALEIFSKIYEKIIKIKGNF